MLHLDAQVEHLSNHRLKLQLKSSEPLVLHGAAGLHHPFLDEDGVMRLRRFLEKAGITPEHPEPVEPQAREDKSKRLVIHLDHRGARLWWLEGNSIETTTLQPHGLWSSHQRLTHRHDRDIAGQRAPLDHEYLNQLSGAVMDSDRVLLIGHGHGQSDMRRLLQKYILEKHPDQAGRIDIATINKTESTDNEILAMARAHYETSQEGRAKEQKDIKR